MTFSYALSSAGLISSLFKKVDTAVKNIVDTVATTAEKMAEFKKKELSNLFHRE